MIKVEITKEMMDWATAKTKAHVKGQKFRSEVDKHNSVLLGYTGDACFQKQYPDATHVDESNYDFIYCDVQIDVKSWWSKYPPKPGYYVQIPTVDIVRHPEVYVFCCILDGFHYGYLVGFMDSYDYKEKSTFHRKGEKNDRLTYCVNCWELPITELESMEGDGKAKTIIIEI